MRVAHVFACAALCSAPVGAKTTTERLSYGRFVVITQVDDNSDHPIPDVESVRREVNLEWRSADGRALFGLHDNGGDLVASYGMNKPDGHDLLCGWVGGGKLLTYPTKRSTERDWQALKSGWIANLAKTCKGAITAGQIDVYQKELGTAQADFLTAIESMKTSARAQFGSLRRCLNYKPIKGTWNLWCVRQSESEN